jgi:hypothetical protein
MPDSPRPIPEENPERQNIHNQDSSTSTSAFTVGQPPKDVDVWGGIDPSGGAWVAAQIPAQGHEQSSTPPPGLTVDQVWNAMHPMSEHLPSGSLTP